MNYYVGIDIGTFESKGVLVDAAGTIVAGASRPHKMLVPKAGWAEHDAERVWWGEFASIAQELISVSSIDPAAIRSVGASAIGPCMLPVDQGGRALMNGVLYGVDTRAKDEIAGLTARYGADTLLRETGNALTSQSVGPKIQWLKQNRADIFARAHKFVTSTTFIVHRLTGKWVIDHYSAGSWSPLYLPGQAGWSPRFAADICAPDALADIQWSTAIAGFVTPQAARETGLAAGTPVITGTIDAAAEAVSVGVLSPGQMMLMYGSTIFIILVTASRQQDARLWYAPWLFPGQHASMAGLATSGTLTHWFRDEFAKELPDTKEAAVALAREAALSPAGANGLIVLPYFSGERTPIHDPDAKGMIFGFNLTHKRGDVYRAVLEGIAHGTRHVMDTYHEAGQTVAQIEAVGGGTNNGAWLQATSDICGLSQNVRSITRGASYGDAFLAALGVGDVKPDDINRWNPVAREVRPEPNLKNLYESQHATFRRLYDRTKDLMHSA